MCDNTKACDITGKAAADAAAVIGKKDLLFEGVVCCAEAYVNSSTARDDTPSSSTHASTLGAAACTSGATEASTLSPRRR